MNNPELYNASNEMQRQTTLQCLIEYGKNIKWKKNEDTAIDLGCGDGSVTAVVKKYTPTKYKKFVGCDINETMVKFANKRYAGEDITFTVLDIGGDLPEGFVGSFDHVFSFYAVQWVKNQEKVFQNIYNLMTDDGDCFLMILANTMIYSIYNVLSHHPHWKLWIKNVESFISPYHEMKDADKKVTEIMKKCGFQNIEVTYKNMTSVHNNVQSLKDTVRSVEPYGMPEDVFDKFAEDFLAVGEKMGLLTFDYSKNKDAPSVAYNFSLVIVCAHKSSGKAFQNVIET
ncbi:juvenile hormone acid O-methyltransferase-like [Anticarsia gemmatalis]|uniref:juvenile hormone acid O-methyltransferase-like n=1 Tax=Anticarsia gemmatalis TaxID=129554 RepID=UPI003F75A5A7